MSKQKNQSKKSRNSTVNTTKTKIESLFVGLISSLKLWFYFSLFLLL
jgi:hypothetical protein